MRILKHNKFPVYPIPNAGKIVQDDGRLIYEVKSGNQYIIDDPRLSGSFGTRRMSTEGVLLPLKKSIPTLGNLILYSSIYKTFIDSNGKLFKYRKAAFYTVIIRPITKKVPYRSGTVLLVQDIHCPIMFYRPLKSGEDFVILTLVDKGYIILGVSTRNYLRRDKIKL
jgi:hypothetical protein